MTQPMMDIHVIPRPVTVTQRPGIFTITAATAIVAGPACQSQAVYLRDLLAPPTGFPLTIVDAVPAGQPAIVLRAGRQDGELGEEGYALTVTAGGIAIDAPTPVGVFYGIQTLRQLLPPAIEQRVEVAGVAWTAPCVAIRDYPRFRWRGYMLDVGRHFWDKATILRVLDHMALQKLNVFHWHLTEDQGWRIEIKRYPRLTDVGAWRPGTKHHLLGAHDGVPHGGFYTQAEIRAIVAYAAARAIMVVPEIELPGHATAALAAYPALSCRGEAVEIPCGGGIFPDLFCAGKEEVFTFLEHVLDEVVPLFPAPFFHIGGDEAPKQRWKQCPECQYRLRTHYLQDEHPLQLYFTNRIAAHLAMHGRRIIGWNDLLQPGLIDSALIQYWVRGRRDVVEALSMGRQVIISRVFATYLDYPYFLTPLRDAYNFEPVFAELTAEAAQNVIGIEAPLWCEWVPDQARLDYQSYPRLPAIAETGWTPARLKSYPDFRRRLLHLLLRFDELGIRYAPLAEVDPGPLERGRRALAILLPQSKTTG